MAAFAELTHEEILRLFYYDQLTGLLRWAVDHGRRIKAGRLVECRSGTGYIHVGIYGKYYRVHRIAWFYVYGEWPGGWLDHKNRDITDNRICNLREVTPRQNNYNSGVGTRNTSGYKGVSFCRRMLQYKAAYRDAEGNRHHLGYHPTLELAAAAYQAAIAYRGEFLPLETLQSAG